MIVPLLDSMRVFVMNSQSHVLSEGSGRRCMHKVLVQKPRGSRLLA